MESVAYISHPLSKGHAPQWAKEWGEDEHGIFAEFDFEDVTQRLRWIPPGKFLMGSPKDEAGRWEGDREGPLHEEVLEEGFWMFETPCTQELWQAVMGENPSRFQSRRRPVDQVSWEAAQEFIQKLNRHLDGLQLALPTEVQWEYACRAGTNTSTYAGELEILGENNGPLLDEIAWYGGNCGVDFDLEDGWDASAWQEKQYEFSRGGTREVGLKRPNAFGLYDMLGNVWEWCSDHWRDNYAAAPDSSFRVVRGGSWGDFAGYVRSACRYGRTPDYRSFDLGFRCVQFQPAIQPVQAGSER